MTMPLVALCADSTSLQHPESIGLAGENLAAQEWLRLFSSSEEARRFLRADHQVGEVWVVSSDDVAPINLAATLKRDRTDRFVCLLAFQETGSLKSRLNATGIDASLSRQAFVERYSRRKRQAIEENALVPQGGAQSAAGFSSQGASGPAVRRFEGQPAPIAHPAPIQSGFASAACAPAGPMHPTLNGTPGVGAGRAQAPASRAEAVRRPAPSTNVAHAASGTRNGSALLMPIVSGSGGAGKSTVSVLTALIAQGLGFNTLLLDFDLQFGDAPFLMGVQNPLTIDEVLRTPARLEQLRSESTRPALLGAPKHLEDAEAAVEHASELIERLAGRFDLIVANTGAAWDEQHAVLLERSTKALFLVDQRPSSVRACQHALDLCGRCGIATSPFLFAINRCAKGAPLTSIDVSCALRGARVAELKDGGREVEELLGAGMPFELLGSRNDLCASLERLLLDVLPEAPNGARSALEADRVSGLRLLKGRRPHKRRRGAACL